MNDRYKNIPDHLKHYIVSQEYESYTPMDHACWRFIMHMSRDFFKEFAHSAYLNGLEEIGIGSNSIPKISDMDEKLQNIGWRAVPVRGFCHQLFLCSFKLTLFYLLHLI